MLFPYSNTTVALSESDEECYVHSGMKKINKPLDHSFSLVHAYTCQLNELS